MNSFKIHCKRFGICFINSHCLLPVALPPDISGISIFYMSLLSVGDGFLNQCLAVLIFKNVIPMKAIILHFGTCFIHYSLSIPVVFNLNTSDISSFVSVLSAGNGFLNQSYSVLIFRNKVSL